MVRSLKIIKSEFITHNTHGFLEQAISQSAEDKLLYQRVSLLRQMHVYNMAMYASMLLIGLICLYAMMY